MKYIRYIGLVIAILLVFTPLSFAEERYNVHVNVKCKDDVLKSSIESFMKRELRNVGNINITDTEPCFKLGIIATNILNIHTRPIGTVVISTIVTFHAKDTPGSDIMDHILITGDGIDSIRELCISLVVAFETNTLEPMRAFKKGKRDEKTNY